MPLLFLHSLRGCRLWSFIYFLIPIRSWFWNWSWLSWFALLLIPKPLSSCSFEPQSLLLSTLRIYGFRSCWPSFTTNSHNSHLYYKQPLSLPTIPIILRPSFHHPRIEALILHYDASFCCCNNLVGIDTPTRFYTC